MANNTYVAVELDENWTQFNKMLELGFWHAGACGGNLSMWLGEGVHPSVNKQVRKINGVKEVGVTTKDPFSDFEKQRR